MSQYEKLFEPFYINHLQIKNRIVMAPMDTKRDSVRNQLSDDTIAYFAERAKGGVGLIITGAFAVNNKIETGLAVNEDLGHTKEIKARIQKLVNECHKYGTKIFLQIGFNFGRSAFKGSVNRLVAPSDQPNLWAPEELCRGLTAREVKRLIRSTAREIKEFAKDGGADGVSIVGPYGGYLADQFATLAFNHRTDEYGGSLENRARFTAETIAEVKELCGKDFPVIVRMSTRSYISGIHEGHIPGEDNVEYGRDVDESIALAKHYVKAGADAFIPANGCYDALYWQYPPMYMPEGLWLDDFEALTKTVDVPVVGTGRILTPALAEEAIEAGKADAVALGRALLADPQWANKAKENRSEEIRPCIGCNNGCIGRVMNAKSIMCAVNADVYNERLQDLIPAKRAKNIAVVGAGIGGMEVARRLKLRGHNVTIYEKGDKTGGIFNVAAAPEFKHGDERLLDWYALQMKKLDIPIQFNSTMTKDSPELLAADEVIVATGSVPKMPPVKGLADANPVVASDVLLKNVEVGKKVVILGAGLIGCETAVELSNDPSLDVSIVEMAGYVMVGGGAEVANPNYEYMTRILGARKNVHLYMHSMAKSCKANVLSVERKRAGNADLPFDTIVVATGLASVHNLYDDLQAVMGDKVHLCGDAEKVGTVMTAVQSAANLGNTL